MKTSSSVGLPPRTAAIEALVPQRIDPVLASYQDARARLEECRVAAWAAVKALERAQTIFNEAERRVIHRWWPAL